MFLTALTVLVTFITCGCSALIARSGVSDRGALSNPKTCAEVRDQFGKPDETRTCADGRIVESRWIRQQIEVFDLPPLSWQSYAEAFGYGALEGAYIGSFGLVDMFVWPFTLYKSEKAKLHYAFVYDEADQLLYVYDLAASPPVQYDEATRFLRGLLDSQLEAENCDTWTACVTDYVQEVRRRAGCLGYTLGNDEEQVFERMFAIGDGVDSGRIPREDGLAEMRKALHVFPQ
jgi:hypothetical protein